MHMQVAVTRIYFSEMLAPAKDLPHTSQMAEDSDE